MVELYRENIEGNKTFIRIKPDQFQEFVVHRRPTVAHKGHHCIRMLYMTLARALFAVSRALFVSRMFYSTFRVLFLQFACSICSSHVLFNIPRALFVARMVYSPFRVLHLQLACSICSSHALFSIPRAPFATRVLYL